MKLKTVMLSRENEDILGHEIFQWSEKWTPKRVSKVIKGDLKRLQIVVDQSRPLRRSGPPALIRAMFNEEEGAVGTPLAFAVLKSQSPNVHVRDIVFRPKLSPTEKGRATKSLLDSLRTDCEGEVTISVDEYNLPAQKILKANQFWAVDCENGEIKFSSKWQDQRFELLPPK